MQNRLSLPFLVALVLLLASCDSGRHSSSGFRLPPSGNAERGKAVFVAFGCHECHQVHGTDLPQPSVHPAVPVTLGGLVDREVTDGFLVTSIVYPSYKIASGPKDQLMVNGESRMPHYADRMTVQQLTDLVAFLQSRYILRQHLPEYGLR
jgi:mono/diheme cytochrome c family protein